MDPKTRKHNIISYQKNKVSISKLRRKNIVDENCYKFCDIIVKNDQQYIMALHDKITDIVPLNIRKELSEAVQEDYKHFVYIDKKYKERINILREKIEEN
jgi:hypothetical protein